GAAHTPGRGAARRLSGAQLGRPCTALRPVDPSGRRGAGLVTVGASAVPTAPGPGRDSDQSFPWPCRRAVSSPTVVTGIVHTKPRHTYAVAAPAVSGRWASSGAASGAPATTASPPGTATRAKRYKAVQG